MLEARRQPFAFNVGSVIDERERGVDQGEQRLRSALMESKVCVQGGCDGGR